MGAGTEAEAGDPYASFGEGLDGGGGDGGVFGGGYDGSLGALDGIGEDSSFDPTAFGDGAPDAGGDVGYAGPADGGGAAYDMASMQEAACTNHPERGADMQCLNCLQGYCMDCLPDGTMCAACKSDPSGRAAPQDDYTPPPPAEFDYDSSMSLDFAGGYTEGADFAGGVDFASGYGTDAGGDFGGGDYGGYTEPAPAPPPPRPKKPAGGGKKPAGGGAKKGAGAAKKGAAKKKGGGLPVVAIMVALVGVLALGSAGWFGYQFWKSKNAKPAFTGKAKVQITQPKHTTISGTQYITVVAASADKIDYIEIKINGKYWDKLRNGKLRSEWITRVSGNGTKVVEAKAVYKNGPTVTDKRTYVVKNR